MTPRPTRQENNSSSDILRPTQPPIRRLLRQPLRPALQLHQPVGHFRREKARRDGVAQNPLRAQLDGQVAREVQRGGFGRAVGESGVLAQTADADACDGGGDEDA